MANYTIKDTYKKKDGSTYTVTRNVKANSAGEAQRLVREREEAKGNKRTSGNIRKK